MLDNLTLQALKDREVYIFTPLDRMLTLESSVTAMKMGISKVIPRLLRLIIISGCEIKLRRLCYNYIAFDLAVFKYDAM